MCFSIVYGCCSKIPFSKENEFWYSIYEDGDNIIFKSNLEDFDTISIIKKVINSPDGKCNVFVSEYDEAHARIDYKVKKDTFDIEQNYLVQYTEAINPNSSLPVLRIFNMEFSEYYNDGDNLQIINCQSISTGWGDEICFLFNQKNCRLNLSQNFGIIEFVWSKSHGLVSYKNREGEKWEYFKKIN